jgi:hypothetical protein
LRLKVAALSDGREQSVPMEEGVYNLAAVRMDGLISHQWTANQHERFKPAYREISSRWDKLTVSK